MSLYEFVGGAPTFFTDPSGERRLSEMDLDRFGTEVATEIRVPFPVVDNSLRKRARWYCADKLIKARGLAMVWNLGIAVGKAPIDAWRMLAGNVLKKLGKKAGKEALKRFWKSINQEKIQTVLRETGDSQQGCSCLMFAVYDPVSESYDGFIHGRVGQIDTDRPAGGGAVRCCSTESFTFHFGGSVTFSKDVTIFGYTILPGSFEDVSLTFSDGE
jgi:uncharacterized protein (DUF433 family)